MDQKIIECLISGHSLTHLTKWTGKSKGYGIKVRDQGLEHGYISGRRRYGTFTWYAR